jgi:hypothetical protein
MTISQDRARHPLSRKSAAMVTTSIRLTRTLHDLIKDASVMNDKSMSSEIASRLEATFVAEGKVFPSLRTILEG